MRKVRSFRKRKDHSILKSINDLIEHLTKEINQLENEIKSLIQEDQELRKTKDILVSFKVAMIKLLLF